MPRDWHTVTEIKKIYLLYIINLNILKNIITFPILLFIIKTEAITSCKIAIKAIKGKE
jgi:hypothetical protein